eukprot:1527919-Prorocentrum_lima.AAC.1
MPRKPWPPRPGQEAKGSPGVVPGPKPTPSGKNVYVAIAEDKLNYEDTPGTTAEQEEAPDEGQEPEGEEVP